MLESEEEHLLLDPGNVLKLYCDANHSGASVVWYKESRPLVPGGRVHLQQSLLEISEVAYEDSGLYVCRARGTGEILRNFTISVVGERPGQCRGERVPAYGGIPHNLPPHADSLASGDDDEDSDGDGPHGDRGEEPVYVHRGECCPGQGRGAVPMALSHARHVCPQRRTGPTRTGWTRSCTPCLRGTPSSFAARPRAAPAPASAGSRTGVNSGGSTASGASG